MPGDPEAGGAPLPDEGIRDALLPFGQSRVLPRPAYVAPEVFAWEQQHLLNRWACMGHGLGLSEPGDQCAVSAGAGGVLLTRGEGGRLRGFANTCRHRGHELLACGDVIRRDRVICPYHSWSYHLDGTLRSAPRLDGTPWFEPEAHGLVELPTGDWHGLVFVDVSCRGGPLERHLDGLEAHVGSYAPERLVVTARRDYVVAANWKVLTENYQECYHCAAIHPELCRVSPPRAGENYAETGGAWVGGWKPLRHGAETMSLSGRSCARPLPGVQGEARRIVDYLVVLPNLWLSLHPDYVMTHVLVPLAPDRTAVTCRWAFSPDDAGRGGFDPGDAVEFWDRTNRQDFAACESVQRGLGSEHWAPGPLAPDEDGVYRFVTMVARAYAGLPLAAAPEQSVGYGR